MTLEQAVNANCGSDSLLRLRLLSSEGSSSGGDGDGVYPPEPTVIALDGELDASTQDAFRKRIKEVVTTFACVRLVLDLTHLEFLDSHGIPTLVDIDLFLKQQPGGMLVVAGALGQPQRVFGIVQAHQFLTLRSTVAEAIEAIGAIEAIETQT